MLENKQMDFMVRVACIYALFLAFSSAPVMADGYPGSYSASAEKVAYPQILITSATQHFYMIHGRLPDSWIEVRDSGLVQVPLVDFAGNEFSPDEEEWAGAGEVKYRKSSSDSAVMQVMLTLGGEHIRTHTFEQSLTFSEMFESAGFTNEADRDYAQILADPEMLRLFAIMGISQRMLRLYVQLHGRAPQNWQEFMDSGLAPVNGSSINPVTGGSFYGDGRSSDFLYEAEGEGFSLRLVDRNGQMPFNLHW